jgi:TusA-related sulfurtransferase
MKSKLTLQNLFKTLSNQTRLEIIVSIFDNNLTASEIAERINRDISTVYRHLIHLKNLGILKSKRVKGIEYFDFSSIKIFQLLESAFEFISEINGEKYIDCSKLKHCYFDNNPLEISPDYILDLRGEICPTPDIQTRKMIDKMKKNQILLVIVDYPLSAERIPVSVIKKGAKIIGRVSEKPGEVKLYIQK